MNKVIVVTGASSGIGKEIARTLSQNGYCVYAASRSVTTGYHHDGITDLHMDIRSEASVVDALQFVEKKHNSIYALINSAGLGMTGSFEFTSDQEIRHLFDTNFFGIANVCRKAIPLLRKNKTARIINITSLAAQIALPYRSSYSASKFAVEGMSEALSLELKQFGIKVCIIEPGDFRTPINAHRLQAQQDDSAVYGDLHNTIRQQIIHEVNTAPTPEKIGTLVLRILKSKRPKLRYRIASPKALLSYRLMRILPSRWFEAILCKYYKI